MTDEKQYSVELKGDYLHLKTWGKLELEHLEEPAEAALKMAKEHNITKILDDIREIDSSNVSIAIQTKGIGILWKLRSLEKVAIIFKSHEIGLLFFNSLEAAHLGKAFRGFDDEQKAIAWLHQTDK